MPRDSAAPPPPPPPVERRAEKSGAGIAAIIAAAVLVCIPLTATSEGERLRPYRDPAHIVTWCDGETQGRPKGAYSSAECRAMLQNRLARDYAPGIAECLPQLADPRRIKIFAAFLDASYNAGIAAVCKSRMAASVRAGRLEQACAGFIGWYVTARDRRTGARIQLRGLVIRRAREAALCREGV